MRGAAGCRPTGPRVETRGRDPGLNGRDPPARASSSPGTSSSVGLRWRKEPITTPITDIASSPSGGETVSSYETYEEAERAVDYLSDNGFPVENAQIVGSNLRLLEQVTGRVTTGRATLAGAGSGAWFGLFIGLLVGLFTTGPTWAGLVLGGLIIGAVWGAIFGFFAHYAMQGRRRAAATSRPAARSSPRATTSWSPPRRSGRGRCSPSSARRSEARDSVRGSLVVPMPGLRVARVV